MLNRCSIDLKFFAFSSGRSSSWSHTFPVVFVPRHTFRPGPVCVRVCVRVLINRPLFMLRRVRLETTRHTHTHTHVFNHFLLPLAQMRCGTLGETKRTDTNRCPSLSPAGVVRLGSRRCGVGHYTASIVCIWEIELQLYGTECAHA